MLPSVVSQKLDTVNDTVSVDTSSGLHLATNSLSINGSVHASGEAYLTVNKVYGSLENERAFQIDGSVHDAGHYEVDVGMERSIEVPAAADLPSAKGFSQVMNNRYEDTCSSIHIDSLVIFDKEMPAFAKVLDSAGYTDSRRIPAALAAG